MNINIIIIDMALLYTYIKHSHSLIPSKCCVGFNLFDKYYEHPENIERISLKVVPN